MTYGVFQFRRGTASQWTSANPTLSSGELGLETDTAKFKVGNGSTAWNSLAYGGIKGDTGSNGTIQGKHAIPIKAGSMRPSLVGGCQSLTAITTASNQPDILSLDFDATTEEYAQFSFSMPEKWNEGTLTAKFKWSHASTTTNFGVVWGIQAVAVSDGDSVAAAFGTAQTVTDTGGTTNVEYTTAETSAITVAGSPQPGDTIYIRVYRKAADASDTLAIDARLHEVVLYPITNADTDA